MDRIDQIFLEFLGDLSPVGALAVESGRSLSICSCVQGMSGRIVDYAQLYVSKAGVVSTSVEGLIDSGDSISAEVGLRMGLNPKVSFQFESPEAIFGKTHDALVSGLVIGFDLEETFLAPYARTYETFKGHSLSLVPMSLLDVRVVAIGLGLIDSSERSLMSACRKLGFKMFVGERAWSKALITMYLLNRIVELFGVKAVLGYVVGGLRSESSAKGGNHSTSVEADQYNLSVGSTSLVLDVSGSQMVDVKGESLLTSEAHAEHQNLQLSKASECGGHDLLKPANEKGSDETSDGSVSGCEVYGRQSLSEDSSAGNESLNKPDQGDPQSVTLNSMMRRSAPVEDGDKPLDLVVYAYSLLDSKRVKHKQTEGILEQIAGCLVTDGFDPERCIYDVQNVILSGLRDGSVDPFALVDQSKVECVRKTVGHKKNMMIKAILLALKKNGVFMDQIEVAACLKVEEENVE